MQVHPAAELFPLLEGTELDELAKDIAEHGQRDPIVLWRGVLVDGRNRLAACELVDVEPRAVEHEFADDADVARYVVSVNIRRRHLNESQRAMLAKRLQKSANLHLDEAADLVNVSERSTKSASVVVERGAPELAAAVDAGNVAVSTAATLTDLPEDEQRDVVARGEKEILKAAKEIRQRKQEERRQDRHERMSSLGTRTLDGLDRFSVICADPPWRYQHAESEIRAIENQYPSMALSDICAMRVSDVAATDAVLFLWATSPKLAESMQVIDAWGSHTARALFGTRKRSAWDTTSVRRTSFSLLRRRASHQRRPQINARRQ